MLLMPLGNRKSVPRLAASRPPPLRRARERGTCTRPIFARCRSGTIDRRGDGHDGPRTRKPQTTNDATAASEDIARRRRRRAAALGAATTLRRSSVRVRSALQGPPTGRRAEGRVSIKLEMSYSLLFCSLESGTPLPKSSTRVTLIRSRS